MRMKFATLFAAAMLFCSVSHVSAQTSQTQGELKFDTVIMKGYSYIATLMAVTSEGNVVVTSTMINGQSLGSFVAMSSPKLPNTPTWKVDIKSGNLHIFAECRSDIRFLSIHRKYIKWCSATCS